MVPAIPDRRQIIIPKYFNVSSQQYRSALQYLHVINKHESTKQSDSTEAWGV